MRHAPRFRPGRATPVLLLVEKIDKTVARTSLYAPPGGTGIAILRYDNRI